VANGDDLKQAADNARLLTKLSAICGAGSLILLLTVWYLSSSRGGAVLMMAAVPYVFSLLFSAGAFIYGILKSQTAREDEEKILLAKRMESRALNVEEDVRFTAGRTFANYRRFVPFALALLAAVIMGVMLWNIDTFRASVTDSAVLAFKASPIHTALVSAVIMMISVFAGAFFVGQSRLVDFRWLRPAGAWLLAGFFAMLLVTVAAICQAKNLTAVDMVCYKILFWVFVVLGAEFPVNFVIEFYRPRTAAEARPVFESQLLALFTEPGGVMRNVASALDYQFGFKVSGTWLYAFVERAFFPVIIAWALVFWGFTTLHEVGANQVGVRESFGKVDSGLLAPGVYWSLPAPFGTVKVFSYSDLHKVVIGESSESAGKRAASPVVLWTNEHGGADDPFVVAVSSKEVAAGDKKVSEQSGDASISFVKMAIPIEYRIRKEGIWNYAYGNVDAVRSLNMIGRQAVCEFLAGATMDELMSKGRLQAERELARRIQALADRDKLGIDIVRVCIMDAHPPVEKVAPAYQEVIGAMEEKETEILKAKAYQASVIPEAEAAALEVVSAAESYSSRIKKVAAAESERFKSRMASYRILPGLFKLNSKLELIVDLKDVRKYVVSSGLKDEIYQLNFETRERLDLVDIDAAELDGKSAGK